MNTFFIALIFASILIGFYSCQNDGENLTPNNNNEETEYEQYGTPFENVPEIQDIIMYEINLRAFSSTGDIQ